MEQTKTDRRWLQLRDADSEILLVDHILKSEPIQRRAGRAALEPAGPRIGGAKHRRGVKNRATSDGIAQIKQVSSLGFGFFCYFFNRNKKCDDNVLLPHLIRVVGGQNNLAQVRKPTKTCDQSSWSHWPQLELRCASIHTYDCQTQSKERSFSAPILQTLTFRDWSKKFV